MGKFFILLGLLCNRWIIGWLFASNGTIESIPFNLAIIALQVILIGYGITCLVIGKSPLLDLINNIFLAGFVMLITAFLFDLGLGALGFPADNLPQVSHPPNQDYLVNNIEFQYPFITNSYGIRDDEIPLRKPGNTFRIAVVGDSFTEGAGVPIEKTFSSIAEGLMSTPDQNVELLNCGLSGTGPLQHARILFHVCMGYDPDAVIIALHSNDVTDTLPENTPGDIDSDGNERIGVPGILHSLWPRVYVMWEKVETLRDQPAVANIPMNVTHEERSEIIAGPSPEEILEKILAQGDPKEDSELINYVLSEVPNHPYISQERVQEWVESLPPRLVAAADAQLFNAYILTTGLFHPTYWTEGIDIWGEIGEAKYQAFITLLDTMVERLDRQNIPVGVVLTASPLTYDDRYGDVWRDTGTTVHQEWSTETTELEKRLEIWQADKALPYLNLTPLLREWVDQEPEPLTFYPLDGHWTPDGHAKAAEWIVEWADTWLER